MNLFPLLIRIRQFAPWVLVSASAAVAIVAYLQALHFPFFADDRIYLSGNTKLAGLPLPELWRLFTQPYNEFFEFLPLRELSFWFDLALFGLNPAAFRLHNILLYLLCLPLLYAVTLQIWRFFRPADVAAPWAAAAVTALFALHPALVESVVWISGRKYVLPNLFALLALWLALRARCERGLSAPHAAAALVAFAAMMLSKSSYVTVAPVIALLWVLFWRDIPALDRRRSQLLWPLVILLLAALLLLVFVASSVGREPAYFGIETVTRTLAVLGWLVRLAVSPESRHFLYPLFDDPSFPAMVALGAAVLVACVAGAVMLLRKRSLEGFALAAFILLCLPYLQLINYGAPSLVQDRFLALAAWPVILLLVALAWRLKPALRVILLLVIALPWGYQTIERSRDWRSYEAIIDADIRAYPKYYMPAVHKILAIQLPQGLNRSAAETASSIADPEIKNILIMLIRADYAVRAKAVDTGNPHDAMSLLHDFELALKRVPARTKWNSPLLYVWQFGNRSLAIQWNYLAKHFPEDVSVLYNAGLALLNLDRHSEAEIHLRAAVATQRLPEGVRGTAFKNFGRALLGSGRAAAAEAPLRAALQQVPPDYQAYCLLAEVYKQTARSGEAARAAADCRSRAPDEEARQ